MCFCCSGGFRVDIQVRSIIPTHATIKTPLFQIDDATGRTMTFGEFSDDAIKLARGLHAIGLEKDDVVALCLPNMIEYASITYGGLLGGGIIAGVVTLLTVRKWIYL